MLQSNNCKDCLVPGIQILVLSDVLLCRSQVCSSAVHWQRWPVCGPLCLHLKVLNIVIWSYYVVENTFEPSDVLIVAFCVPAGQLNCSRLYQGLVALHICCSIAQSNHRPKPGSIKSNNIWPSQGGDVKNQCCIATTGELYGKQNHCAVPQVAVTWMFDIKSQCGRFNAHIISWVEKHAEISGKSTVDCAWWENLLAKERTYQVKEMDLERAMELWINSYRCTINLCSTTWWTVYSRTVCFWVEGANQNAKTSVVYMFG